MNKYLISELDDVTIIKNSSYHTIVSARLAEAENLDALSESHKSVSSSDLGSPIHYSNIQKFISKSLYIHYLDVIIILYQPVNNSLSS